MRLSSLSSLLSRSRPARSAPRLADLRRALLTEFDAGLPTGLPTSVDIELLPNSWTVLLASGDHTTLAAHLPAWGRTLADALRREQQGNHLPFAGAVAVGFEVGYDLAPGRFRVRARRGGAPDGLSSEAPAPLPGSPLPGRPRLVLPVGGTTEWGTGAASGIERELVLPSGEFVLGRADDADIRVSEPSVSPRHLELSVGGEHDSVRVRDLGSVNGTLIDGVPVKHARLVDGNRLQLGDLTLVFRRDAGRDEGRQGEGHVPRSASTDQFG